MNGKDKSILFVMGYNDSYTRTPVQDHCRMLRNFEFVALTILPTLILARDGGIATDER